MTDNSSSASQDGRVGSLTTPLGKDVLLLGAFVGTEGLGELFEYRIDALSEQANINFNQLIGLNLSVHLNSVDNVGRDFSGVLVEARSLGINGRYYSYRLVLKPWLWLLSHTSDCRIFSSMKVTDIIVKIFTDRGFNDYRNATTASYPTLEYCVQYRESDMNFVFRLMEEYGIYYFFEYEKGDGSSPSKHTLVMADSKTCHTATPGLASVPYLPTTVGAAPTQQKFDNWATYRGFQSGRFVLSDYDYDKPGSNLLADAEHSGGYTHGSMEIYDYPGDYDNQAEGKTLAKVRLDADQIKDDRRMAFGYAPSLLPGYTTKRTSNGSSNNQPDPDDNIEYLVLRCSFSYAYQSYESSGGSDGAYAGSYELVSSDRTFRSPLSTRKPIIPGTQSALVVGKKGEEIDVDEEGRIAVVFYWDRKKTGSRRIRVAQFWAGKDRGAIFLPRIGDEVLVQYEEGDPDRPVVVGSVYNGANTPWEFLPGDKTRSGVQTKSSKNSEGYNLLQFEDLVGSEFIKVHAEKDINVIAKNNETRAIGGNQDEDITGNLFQTVGGNMKIFVAMPDEGKPVGDYHLETSNHITLKVGSSIVYMTFGEIKLSVGDGTSITLDSSGITLNAPTITVTGKAAVDVHAPKVGLTGDAAVNLTGQINTITGVGSTIITGGSISLAAPTIAPNITGATPAGIPLV